MTIAKGGPRVKQNQVELHEQKSSILAEHCRSLPLAPLDYYRSIFNVRGNDTGVFVDDLRPIYVLSGEQRRRVCHTVDDIEEMLSRAIFAPDMAVPLGVFYQNWRSKKLLKTLCALVIDVEYVNSWQLLALFDRLKAAKVRPMFLVNSGNGIHLVYVIEPVECYGYKVQAIDRLYRQLLQWWSEAFTSKDKTWRLKIDTGVSIVQPFRIVGGRTKAHLKCEAYPYDKPTTIEELGRWLDVKMPKSGKEQYKQNVTGNVREGRREMRKKLGIALLPNAKKGFYQAALERMHYPEPGGRYYFLLTLAAIGYKSRIPRAKVEEDVRRIAEVLNARDEENPLTEENIQAALQGYSQQFVDLTREKINELGGFDFKPCKRNGRTQEEHLKRVHARRRGATREEVHDYAKKHPGATQTQTAQALGITRKTVGKYWPR